MLIVSLSERPRFSEDLAVLVLHCQCGIHFTLTLDFSYNLLGVLVAIHQVLEKIIILRSSLYSIRVLTYYVDGRLSSIKQITQATGDLQAI